MQSVPASRFHYTGAFSRLVSHLHASPRTALRMCVVACMAIVLATGAAGDDLPGDPDDPPGGGGEPAQHEQPWLENLQIFFDGIDQYAITGQVTHCDEIGGVRIDIGGAVGDHWTTTEFDGSFFLLVIHDPVASGSIISGVATCHEGMSSDEMLAEVY